MDKILYETDKHCADNVQMLIMFLALHGVMKEEIKDIYVLGHSISPVDLEYFAFLMDATKVESEVEESEEIEAEEIDDLHNRMQYVINTVGYGGQASEEEIEAAKASLPELTEEDEKTGEEVQEDTGRRMVYMTAVIAAAVVLVVVIFLILVLKDRKKKKNFSDKDGGSNSGSSSDGSGDSDWDDDEDDEW